MSKDVFAPFADSISEIGDFLAQHGYLKTSAGFVGQALDHRLAETGNSKLSTNNVNYFKLEDYELSLIEFVHIKSNAEEVCNVLFAKTTSISSPAVALSTDNIHFLPIEEFVADIKGGKGLNTLNELMRMESKEQQAPTQKPVLVAETLHL